MNDRSRITRASAAAFGLAMAFGTVAACNTVEGAGEDIESVGEAIDEGAEDSGEDDRSGPDDPETIIPDAPD